MVYLSIFFTAFLSASLLPLGSEGLLIYYIKTGHNIFWLFIFATIGNVLGSVLNYYLGLKGEEYLLKKKYIKRPLYIKAKDRFNKLGAFVLLFSFMPIVGDPLTFIAGVLKYNFKWFLLLVFISKATRYLFVILLINTFS